MFNIVTNIIKKLYNYFENENLIVDKKSKIWVGNYITGSNIDFLRKNDIKLVINCTQDLPWIKQSELSIKDYILLNKIKFDRIPCLDSLEDKGMRIMYTSFDPVLDSMFKSYRRNENILVYCHMGRQRSQILMAAFLYKYKEYFPELNIKTKEDVFNYILTKRPQAFSFGLRVNFLPSFKKYFNL